MTGSQVDPHPAATPERLHEIADRLDRMNDAGMAACKDPVDAPALRALADDLEAARSAVVQPTRDQLAHVIGLVFAGTPWAIGNGPSWRDYDVADAVLAAFWPGSPEPDCPTRDQIAHVVAGATDPLSAKWAEPSDYEITDALLAEFQVFWPGTPEPAKPPLTWDDLCSKCGHAPKDHDDGSGYCHQRIGYRNVGGSIGKRMFPCPCSSLVPNALPAGSPEETPRHHYIGPFSRRQPPGSPEEGNTR